MDLSKLELYPTDTLKEIKIGIERVLTARLDTTPRVGRVAEFTASDGTVRRIMIDRLNTKTVSGKELPDSHKPGQGWRVGYSGLRVEGRERIAPPKPPVHVPKKLADDVW